MGVSKNNAIPKSSILIGFSLTNHPFLWFSPIFGNTHVWKWMDEPRKVPKIPPNRRFFKLFLQIQFHPNRRLQHTFHQHLWPWPLSATFRRPKGTQRQCDACPFADHGVSRGKSWSLSLSTWKTPPEASTEGSTWLHLPQRHLQILPAHRQIHRCAPGFSGGDCLRQGIFCLETKKSWPRFQAIPNSVYQFGEIFVRMLWIWEFGTLSHESLKRKFSARVGIIE